MHPSPRVPPAVLASCLSEPERARARDALNQIRVPINEDGNEEGVGAGQENQVIVVGPGRSLESARRLSKLGGGIHVVGLEVLEQRCKQQRGVPTGVVLRDTLKDQVAAGWQSSGAPTQGTPPRAPWLECNGLGLRHRLVAMASPGEEGRRTNEERGRRTRDLRAAEQRRAGRRPYGTSTQP